MYNTESTNVVPTDDRSLTALVLNMEFLVPQLRELQLFDEVEFYEKRMNVISDYLSDKAPSKRAAAVAAAKEGFRFAQQKYNQDVAAYCN